MPRWTALPCLLLAALLAAGCVTTVASLEGPVDVIVVNGNGRVNVAPDIGVLMLGVEAQAPTLEEATADAARRMTAVVERVKALGVAAADLATVAYTVDPRMTPPDPARRDPPRIVGYHVTNLVQVTVRRLGDTGRILDAAVAAGANAVRGIRFTLADPSGAEAEARTRAVADALARARGLAAAAGVTLGPVVAIREGGASPPVPMMRTMVLRTESTPIEPGQLDVVVTVELRQAIRR